MRNILLPALMLVVSHAYAQTLATLAEGNILFNDGRQLEGMLAYNKETGMLRFQSDTSSINYNARNLAGFEYDDRHFYSIPYRSSAGVVKQFFEVIREYKDFAIVAKTNLLSPTTTSELTTLYFLKASDLSITPYLEVLTREVRWGVFDMNKTQVRIFNSSFPKQLMGENFEKVKAFAKERKLVWHVKDSLISILDYYDSLVSQ